MTFKVKDLMINVVASGGGGGAMMPADDGPIPTPLTPHTPVISVAAITSQFRLLAPILKEAMKSKVGAFERADAVARSVGTVPDTSPALGGLLNKLNRVAVGAAIIAHGGGAEMPNPECDNSIETIPTPLTPVAMDARSVLSRSQIPALKNQLKQVLAAVEKAELELAPKGRDVAVVRAQLEGALGELKNASVK